MSRHLAAFVFLFVVYEAVAQQDFLSSLLGTQNGGQRGPQNNNPFQLGQMFGRPGPNTQLQRPNQMANQRQMNDFMGQMSRMVNDVAKQVGGEDVVNQLKSLTSQPPDWNDKARRLCRRYPGHPQCRGGQLPQFRNLNNLLQSVLKNGGQYLPRVPIMFIQDPLRGISTELSAIARQFNIDFGAISRTISNVIMGVCRQMRCDVQSPQSRQLKDLVSKRIFAFEKSLTGRDPEASVSLRMDRTQQIKQALLEKANLGNTVTASDDGVFDKDILLTETQQNFLLNELGKGGVGVNGRAGRSSLYFENNYAQKWDISRPIPYTFDSALAEYDKNDVRAALAEISQKTCIRFQYVARPVGAHINYQKVDSPTFCGLSYVGKAEPANPIYLSFQCGNSKGIAVHETMHALGVGHQHLRMDRDKHLTINWQNINPQHYDYFVVSDSKLYTTYGVKYDYGSIMHYNAYTGAVNIAQPTMVPKVNPSANQSKLGQRDAMSASDVELLNKMYCQAGCDDRNIYCGAWALTNICSTNTWMQSNCMKSCNLCRRG